MEKIVPLDSVDSVIDFIEEFLVPGSFWFLFLGLCAGVALFFWHDRGTRYARRWLSMLVGLYLLLSLPQVSWGLEAGLVQDYPEITKATQVKGATAIVVLHGGGQKLSARGQEFTMVSAPTFFRAFEGARLYKLLGSPWVIVSGGVRDERGNIKPYKALEEVLIKAGVAAERIMLESASRNTREQATNLAPVLREHEIKRCLLVTSPTHMRRAIATFEAAGLDIVPSASADRFKAPPGIAFRFLPSAKALGASRWAIREYLAVAYYWWRGWLSQT